MDKKLLKVAVINSLMVLVYVIFVVGAMTYFDKYMEHSSPEFLLPIVVLMLLVLSAAVVGTLIFARPVMIYLDGGKKEGLKLLTYTLGCLVVLTILAFVVVSLV